MRLRKIRWAADGNSNKGFCRVFWTVEEMLGELCEVPRCLCWRRLRCHCPKCNVSGIFFNKCLYFLYDMAGHFLDRPHIMLDHICLQYNLKDNPIFLLLLLTSLYIFSLFFFFFSKRAGEGEREGEKHWCVRYIDRLPLECPQLGTSPANQACTLTGNWTDDLLVCRLALSPLSHTSQGCIFSLNTEMFINFD